MGGDAGTRQLTPEEESWIASARDKADALYAGVVVAHRSCGVALAETFGLPHRPYQSLRKGGITGEGYCGAILAGELVLGEILGDPSPTGAVTDGLRHAMIWYRERVPERIDRRSSPDYICNHLTRQHGDFKGPARAQHCTEIAAQVAGLTAEALVRFGRGLEIEITPLAEETG